MESRPPHVKAAVDSQLGKAVLPVHDAGPHLDWLLTTTHLLSAK